MNIYTIKEVAQIFKLDYQLIEELLNKEKLGCIKICNKIRITENQLKTFIEKKENEIDFFFTKSEPEEEKSLFEELIGDDYEEPEELEEENVWDF